MTAAHTGSAQARRGFAGPAILSHGYRPFFLLAGLWAAGSMALWIAMLSGMIQPPSPFSPTDWHAHAFLFGYGSAAVAGFLLTAVPNWTGRLPIMGAPLAGLAGLWVAGRLAVTFGAGLGPLAVAIIDLSALVCLAAAIAREIVAGRNWRNLKVLALLLLLVAANGVFHWEAASAGAAAQGFGARLALGALIALIVLIGGRIVPSFTRNWLAKRRPGPMPVSEDWLDRAALGVTAAGLLVWLFAPDTPAAGIGLLVLGCATAARLGRWQGWRTGGEPLVWVLHLGYGFVPLGAFAMGMAVLFAPSVAIVAKHLWMAGAIGMMTLAVMTRASLGHGGLPLSVGWKVASLYAALAASVVARVLAGSGIVAPALSFPLLSLSGALWIVAFAGFAALYWPVFTQPRGAIRFHGGSGGKSSAGKAE